jgi:hypothetical protein
MSDAHRTLTVALIPAKALVHAQHARRSRLTGCWEPDQGDHRRWTMLSLTARQTDVATSRGATSTGV